MDEVSRGIAMAALTLRLILAQVGRRARGSSGLVGTSLQGPRFESETA